MAHPPRPTTPEAPVRSGSETISRILSAAEALFAEHGYEAVSMHSIAERAGVSKANVFHHFTSKRELYLAVLNGACADTVQHLENLETRTGAFAERFSKYAAGMLSSFLEQEHLHRLIQRELLADNDGQLAKEMAERTFRDKFARLVAALRAGQTDGELRQGFDPAMAAIVLIGANVFFQQSRNVFKHFPDISFANDPARYTELLTDVLLNGILAPPAK